MKEKTQTGPQSNRNAPPHSVYKFSVTYSVFHVLKHIHTPALDKKEAMFVMQSTGRERRGAILPVYNSPSLSPQQASKTLTPIFNKSLPHVTSTRGANWKGMGVRRKNKGCFWALLPRDLFTECVFVCVCVCVCVCVLGALTHSQFVTLDASQWHRGGKVKSYLRQCMGAHGRGH